MVKCVILTANIRGHCRLASLLGQLVFLLFAIDLSFLEESALH